MSPSSLRLILMCCALLQGLLVVQPSSAAPRVLVGRTVSSVLAELTDPGLKFIYSSELVPDSMRVLQEPLHRDRLRIAREILADHGLIISAVRGDLYVILPAKRAAQTRVTGRVVDAESGAAVPGARIELRPLGLTRNADDDGRFIFEPVPASEYRLHVSASDYGPIDAFAGEPRGAGANDVTLRMPRAALAEVVVAASRYQFGVDLEGSAYRISRSQLDSQPSIAEDPLRSATRLPGVASDGISAPPNVRGGSADEVLVLLDGFPLRRVYHLPGYQSLFSVLDENIIDAAEIYTGGFGARYGNRISGVIDLATIDSAQEPRRSVGVSFVNANARWGGPFERIDGDMLLAARVGTLGPIIDAMTSDKGPRFSDSLARFGFDLSPELRLRATALLAEDELEVDDDDEQAEFESAANYLWLQALWNPSEELSASAWLGRSTFKMDRNGSMEKEGFLVGAARDARRADVTDFRAALEWQAHEDHRLSAGLEWSAAHADYDYASEALYGEEIAELFDRPAGFERAVELGLTSQRIALFASDRWRISPRWVAEIGLRAQQTSYSRGATSTTLDPRLSLRVNLAPSTLLRFHWGRFHQADEASDLRVEDGIVAAQTPRRADHLIVGLEHQWRGGLLLRVEAFRKRELRPRIRFENALSRLELLPELAPDRIAIAPDSAEITGVELSLNYERDDSNTWISITRSTATDEFSTQEAARSWDQSWAAQTGMEWRRGPWLASAALGWHRGWPTTRLATEPDGTITLGERNAARLPSYGVLDLRGEYRRPLARGSLVITLEISNAANRRNICCTDIEVEEDEEGDLVIFGDPQHSLPLLPSLAVKWEF
jgi:outer membrane receptor protein involved in Fe transport